MKRMNEQTPDACREEPSAACCASAAPWMEDTVATAAGPIPVVRTKLTREDIFGGWKARWDIDRMDYRITPGLYAVGKPDKTSPVLVTANYKLTFDSLRRELGGLDLWIMVLDTKGINVWCAAGKGTFGTDEIVRRVRAVRLESVVRHRRLVLPQLGAPGVSAHEVSRQTGFSVVYGPVRAEDLRAWVATGCVATPEMRRVRFTFRDRLVLTPTELSQTVRKGMPVLGVLFVLTMLGVVRFDRLDFLALTAAWLSGTLLTPALLPWIPGRAFAWKGWLVGLAATLGLMAAASPVFAPLSGRATDMARALAWLLMFPSVSAFLAMNFTGSSTFTSPSGVLREMKIAVPLMVVGAFLGAIGFVAGRFL